MSSKIPTVVIVLAGIIATIYLICSMTLLSSIIAWLSLEFSIELPCALSFVIGTLSLLGGILAILMVGISRLRRVLGLVFLIVAVIVVMAGVGLVVPFALTYLGGDERLIGQICNDCNELGRATQQCVDLCNDECCFVNMSEPLILVFVAATGTAVVNSIVGLAVGVVHLYITPWSSSKQH